MKLAASATLKDLRQVLINCTTQVNIRHNRNWRLVSGTGWHSVVEKDLDAYQQWCLRRLLCISHLQRVTNTEVLRRTN